MSSERILVVDDDENQVASLRRILRRSRLEVETATSGRIALRKAMKNPPDLILLDVMMPGMSGHEFLRRFQRLQARRISSAKGIGANLIHEIPVIFLTGRTKSKDRVDGLDAGAVDYVTKPVDPNELRARIRAHLRRVRRQKDILALARAELLRLDYAMDGAQGISRQCRERLMNLNTLIELSMHVSLPELRENILNIAKDDVRYLLEQMLCIVQSPVGQLP